MTPTELADLATTIEAAIERTRRRGYENVLVPIWIAVPLLAALRSKPDPAAGEARLREALRHTVLHLHGDSHSKIPGIVGWETCPISSCVRARAALSPASKPDGETP